jgi:hypothetical protein
MVGNGVGLPSPREDFIIHWVIVHIYLSRPGPKVA